MSADPTHIWWTAAEIAASGLPDLPNTKRGVNDLAKREGWAAMPDKMRRRKGRGGGVEYHWTVLPARARMKLVDQSEEAQDELRPAGEAWADFDKLRESQKEKAKARLKIIGDVESLQAAGLPKSAAVDQIAKTGAASSRTIWLWFELISGVSEADRLAYIAPRPTGSRAKKSEIDPEFAALVRSDWLRLSQPSLTACYRRSVRVAKAEGMATAPLHQIRRHFAETISKPTEVFLRQGAEALKRLYPHQDRDKTAMVPLECVCGDYHKFDVFVRWPGEENPVRVQMVAFSDVYSGKILAWRLSLTANSHTVQLCLGDVFRTYGIPQGALLDNGREFANKALTGGAETRFRFKIKEDDIPGLLPLMGTKIHWATPYSGQSKPIERTFRDLCDTVAKHPAFEGAYTGNNPSAKPENYGNRAIPLEEFQAVLADEIEEHNARPDRRSEVAFGRSFNDVFNEGYKRAKIRKASAAQLRMWLMGADGVRGKPGNGELKVMGNRYRAPWMYQIAEKRVVARFDPDNLHAGIEVYTLQGEYLDHAPVVAKGGFNSVQDAKDLARKRTQWEKASKQEARAAQEYSAEEIAARLREAGSDVTRDALPEASVVQLVPTRTKPTPDAEAAKPAAPVARLADHRAQDADEGDQGNEYDRVCELERRIKAGEPFTEQQRAWMAEFKLSAKYRAQEKMAKAFGQKNKG